MDETTDDSWPSQAISSNDLSLQRS